MTAIYEEQNSVNHNMIWRNLQYPGFTSMEWLPRLVIPVHISAKRLNAMLKMHLVYLSSQ